MTFRSKTIFAALVVGLVIGGIGQLPVRADEDACPTGCCKGETVECGSPFSFRCCIPTSQEMGCAPDGCINHCVAGTSCTPLDGG